MVSLSGTIEQKNSKDHATQVKLLRRGASQESTVLGRLVSWIHNYV